MPSEIGEDKHGQGQTRKDKHGHTQIPSHDCHQADVTSGIEATKPPAMGSPPTTSAARRVSRRARWTPTARRRPTASLKNIDKQDKHGHTQIPSHDCHHADVTSGIEATKPPAMGSPGVPATSAARLVSRRAKNRDTHNFRLTTAITLISPVASKQQSLLPGVGLGHRPAQSAGLRSPRSLCWRQLQAIEGTHDSGLTGCK